MAWWYFGISIMHLSKTLDSFSIKEEQIAWYDFFLKNKCPMEFYSLIFLISFGKAIASEKVSTLPMIPESQHTSPDLPIFVYTDFGQSMPPTTALCSL